MFVQKVASFDEHASQNKNCSLCGRDAPWVESYKAEISEFSLDDYCHMFHLHKKLYIGRPFDKEVLDALYYYNAKCRFDQERSSQPVTIYWESNGGFLSAPYMLQGLFVADSQIYKEEPTLPIEITYVGDSSGGGAFAAFAFEAENRKILADARVNFYAEKKPSDFKNDELFTRQFHLLSGMADEMAKTSKWSADEMKEMMKNIHSSYKYIYAVEDIPKTFYDFFIKEMVDKLSISQEEATKIISEDKWWSADELCNLGYFSEIVEPNAEIKKDLGFIRPS